MVLDTQVWLDLLVFRDPRVASLASALRDGSVRALTEPRMRAELERVLAYRALALDAERRAAVLREFDDRAVIQPTPPPAPAAPRCRDPDDQMFIDLALATRADALLSRDAAVLRLAAPLRREGVEVSTPAGWRRGEASQISKR